ncbi:MAG TPA: capsule assembly Wzi family protein [Terriglobales bacterium]|nr:capsule assembly Wzi family protein [Terriglobales bacterium]
MPKFPSVLVSLLIVLLFCPSLSYPTSLENIPLNSWVYPSIEELYTQGLFPKLARGNKPYSRGEIASYLQEINARVEKGDLALTSAQSWIIDKLKSEFEYELKALSDESDTSEKKEESKKLKALLGPVLYLASNEQDSSYVRGKGILEGTFQWKNFLFKDRIILDTKSEKETNFFGQKWKGDLTGVFDQGYIKVNFKYFEFQWGRDYMRWGPGSRDHLLLSGFSPPYDMLKLKGKIGIFEFDFFATGLDQIFLPDSNFFAKRYFSGHRMNLKFKSGIELGFSEVVVYGGPGRKLEPYYLNPLFLFYGEQFNHNIDDNLLWSFDFSITHFKNKEFYGELLIDDFQYDFKSEPQQIGFLLGTRAADLFGFSRSYLTLEYTRINKWVYGQDKPWNLYTYRNVGMGSFLGPDADDFFTELQYHFSKSIQVSFSYELKRKGEGRIGLQPSTVPKTTSFPSGIVEKTNSFDLEGVFQPDAHLFVEGELGYADVKNQYNISGKKGTNFSFRISLNYNFWKEKWF